MVAKKNSKNFSRVHENSPIFEYYRKIESGEIVTSLKVKRIYKHIVECLKKGDKFAYSKDRAERAVDFIQKFCKHSKGNWGRQPTRLELWQKAFICALFGVVYKKTGERRFKEAFLVIDSAILSYIMSSYILRAYSLSFPARHVF